MRENVMAINSHALTARVKTSQNGTLQPIDLLISTHIPHSNISFERKPLSMDERSVCKIAAIEDIKLRNKYFLFLKN